MQVFGDNPFVIVEIKRLVSRHKNPEYENDKTY